jgi:CheY-like chemotaxis protein
MGISHQHESINVLLVEDDEMDVEAIRRVFKKKNIGNPLFHATCGVDALAMLRGEGGHEKIPQPYVLLVDINMPQMNGLDFLSEVRRDGKLKNSVAFMLTTSSRDADVERAYELNAAGYFLKDDLGTLASMIGLYKEINQFADHQSPYRLTK